MHSLPLNDPWLAKETREDQATGAPIFAGVISSLLASRQHNMASALLLGVSAAAGVLALCLAVIVAVFMRAMISLSRTVDLMRMLDRAKPPWSVSHNKHYAAFISHYKRESGSDARYIKDVLQPMLGARVYLDSDNLKDLRDLFEGVRHSDVLLILATRDVLTRPYCLLELWAAANARIPVIVLNIEGGAPSPPARAL